MRITFALEQAVTALRGSIPVRQYLSPFFAVALRPNAGHGLLILEVF
jgi:hypothetical protein